MNQDKVNKILNDLETGYDSVADKFSGTRNFFWPELAFLSKFVSNGDRVLDYGCGNGRLLEILKNKKIEYHGIDVSQKLIELAKIKYSEKKDNFSKITVQGSLAFPDNFFNKVFSIAVFHHFPPSFAKNQARELFRVTAKNGLVIITTWNLWQKRHRSSIFSPKQIFMRLVKGQGFFGINIPFQDNNGKIFSRYHYAYTSKKLAKIFETSGFAIEKLEKVSEKNWLLIARKKSSR